MRTSLKIVLAFAISTGIAISAFAGSPATRHAPGNKDASRVAGSVIAGCQQVEYDVDGQVAESRPALKLYIIGHTDNTHAFANYMKLLAATLPTRWSRYWKRAASRMAAKGLASYAPMAATTLSRAAPAIST